MSPDPGRLFHELDRWPSPGPLVAAVSGGGDSLALLLLLHAFAGRRPGVDLLAVTVDHGLRRESAQEAAAVAGFCRALGVPHRIVTWDGEKPARGLMAAARAARYDLLAGAAAEAGGGIILTGHTMDDQAETVAMRGARGPGAGLAGMARATWFDDRVWIARPLLGVRRSGLRALLRDRKVAWADDPSNKDTAYERVRIRTALSEREIDALAAQAHLAGLVRAENAAAAAMLLDRHAGRPAPGLFRLERGLFDRAGEGEPALLAFRVMLALAGGAALLPDGDRAGLLMRRLGGGEIRRATLSRAVVEARKEAVFLRREARDVARLDLTQHAAIWDGRWRVAAGGTDQRLTVGPAGIAAARAAGAECPDAPAALVRAAGALEPALFAGDRPCGLLADAARHGVVAAPVVGPHARFLPGFDLELSASLRRLLGLPALPEPPLKEHIANEA